MLVNIDCPIELLDYQLYRSKSSGKVYCSLKFNNVSEKKVKGLKVLIYCYDQFGDPINQQNNSFEYEFQLEDAVIMNQSFSTEEKILLDEFSNARKIDVDIIKVLFDDQIIWEKGSTVLEEVKLTEINNPKQLVFVKANAGEYARYFAKKIDDKWLCVCGRLNYDYFLKCKRCSQEKDDILLNYCDEETISRNLEAYEAKLKELRQKELEERERQLQVKKQKNKKITLYTSIIFGLIVVIGVAVFGFMTSFTFSYENYQLLRDKDEALIKAVKAGDLNQVEFLLENGADVRHKNNKGENSVSEAIELGNKKLTYSLLSSDSINIKVGQDGNTLAHIAVENEHLEILKKLHELGLDMNTKNDKKETVVYSAIKIGNKDIINYLIKDIGVDIQNIDSKKNNVVQVALLHQPKNIELIKELLNLKIDLTKVNSEGRNTYQSAILTQNINIVIDLMNLGLDLNNVDGVSNNALHVLLETNKENRQFLKELINEGTNVNGYNNQGYAPLYIAIKNGQKYSVDELLTNKADINKVTSDGQSALIVAQETSKEMEDVINRYIGEIRAENERKKKEEESKSNLKDIVINYKITENSFVNLASDIVQINLKVNQKIILKPTFEGDAYERVLMDGTILNSINSQTIQAIQKGTGTLTIIPYGYDWDNAKEIKIVVN